MSDAVEAIYTYSRGIPRVINLLCEHALINAYVDQRLPIPATIVDEAACELQFDEFRPVAPCVQTIHKSARTADLHSILAKIQADADENHRWRGANKASPYLINDQKTGVNNQSEAIALDDGKRTNRQSVEIPSVAGLPRGSSIPIDSQGNITGLQPNHFAKSFLASLAAVRALSQNFSFRVQLGRALGLARGLRLENKLIAITNWMRSPSAAPRVLVSEIFGPEVEVRARDLVNIVIQARQKFQKDGSQMAANMMRWLRAPIYPMQIRGLGSIGDKIQTQRRA